MRRVVVASSRAIYGEGCYLSDELGTVYPGPRREADMADGRFEPSVPGAVTPLEVVPTPEDSPAHPGSVYGITKLAQELLVMTVCGSLGIESVALRYQNVYGPGQSLTNPYTGILSIFSTRILNRQPINIFEDGEESRDFVFIDDVVRATCMAAVVPDVGSAVVNIGSGVRTSVSQVVDALMGAYGIKVPVEISGNFRIGDIRHNLADISAARALLGYEPSVDFTSGVNQFASWVQAQAIASSPYDGSLAEMRARNLLK